jgi:hypothetical protein
LSQVKGLRTTSQYNGTGNFWRQTGNFLEEQGFLARSAGRGAAQQTMTAAVALMAGTADHLPDDTLKRR